jgi:hypothetical protein
MTLHQIPQTGSMVIKFIVKVQQDLS